MDALHSNLESVRKKLRQQRVLKAVDALIGRLSEPHADLDALKAAVTSDATLEKVQKEHKSVHNAIAKLGKAVDKAVPDAAARFSQHPMTRAEASGMHAAMVDHLYRSGRFREGDLVAAATGQRTEATLRAILQTVFALAAQINDGRYKEPLRWAAAHRESLAGIASPLEFELHALQFVSFLCAPPTAVPGAPPPVALALAYSRRVFPHFAEDHMPVIKRLMAATLFAGSLPTSPYADLASPAHVEGVRHRFLCDSCRVMGIAPKSALMQALTASKAALPTLLKLADKMAAAGVHLDPGADLPVEVPLPEDLHFHSVFACPVSRENTKPDNPPVMLRCGHVVSKESLLGLAARRARFKCPTCPTMQSLRDTREIRFV